MTWGHLARFAGALVLLAIASGPIGAAENGVAPPGEAAANRIAGWERQLDTMEGFLEQPRDLPASVREALRALLQQILVDTADSRQADEARLGPLQEQLQSLGPAPAEGEPPEAEETAAIRERLLAQVREQEGRISRTQLAEVRAKDLLGRLERRQQVLLQAQLFQPSPSLLSAAVWITAWQEATNLAVAIVEAPAAWWAKAKETWRWARLAGIIVAGLAAALLALPARRWLLRRFGRRARETKPEYGRRIGAATVTALADVILPVIALTAIIVLTNRLKTPDVLLPELLIAACKVGIMFIVISGLARAALAPRWPIWRILPVTEEGAVILWHRVVLLAGVAAASWFPRLAIDALGEPSAEFDAVLRLFSSTIVAGLLLTLLPARLWEKSEGDVGGIFWPALRLIFALFLISVPVVSLAGYSFLATFALGRLIYTAIVVGAALLAHVAVREFLATLLTPGGKPFRLVSRSLGLREGSARIALFWTGLFIDLLIFVPVAYLLLISYGLPAGVVNLWLRDIVTGIQIGGVTISLVDIALAAVALVVALIITGSVRRWLAEKVLSHTRLDAGLRNSIAAGVGYVGVAISILLAIAVAGLDLSNLALVAGALSVGIGFGLRAVVENFVSGLLLLIGRPIKEGDWIVAGGHEGTVKRISVRSTEIETFDRASVIVPNSELIAQPVMNWTYKNRMARIILNVGVAYGSDTKKVRDLLLECAKAQERVLSYPDPYVIFHGFGDSALNFQLRCYVPDTDYFLSTKSDLNFAIDEAFRANGIEIPFPQRDLHLRSGPQMRISDEDREGEVIEVRQDSWQGADHPPETDERTAPDRGRS